jgi:serine/threonine-protein kinase RsbW
METKASLQLSAELEDLALVRRFVQDTAAELHADPAVIPDVVMAVNEAVTNIIVHGYRGQPGMIRIDVGRIDNSLGIRLRDHAPPFDPTAVPPPDLHLPLSQRPFGGLGIYLIRQTMDELSYRTPTRGGNELILVKKDILQN